MAKDSPRRLGRGLESLISIDKRELPPRESAERSAGGPRIQNIPVGRIRAGKMQPRQDFDDRSLQSLADSIRKTGVLQPLILREVPDGYELIAGERRLRASRLAGIDAVPAIVRTADDENALELALIENLQRSDLNSIDRAKAYRRFCTEFGLSISELAERTSEDRSTVSNILRLLDLPETVQDCVVQGLLSAGHARCILGVEREADRIQLAELTVREEWSVRRLEQEVAQRKRPKQMAEAKPTKSEKRPQIVELEGRLADSLGTRVRIREGRKKNTGCIMIDYFSIDDVDRILERLGLSSEL